MKWNQIQEKEHNLEQKKIKNEVNKGKSCSDETRHQWC